MTIPRQLLTRHSFSADVFYLLSPKEQQAGRALHAQGMAEVLAFSPTEARCRVRDGQRAFEVTITSTFYLSPEFRCDCPKAKRERQCPHMVAAALATRDYIASVAEKDWAYRLEVGLANAASVAIQQPPQRRRPSARQVPAIVLAGLELRGQARFHAADLALYALSARRWPAVLSLADSADPRQAAHDLLATHDDWHPLIQPYTLKVRWQPANITDEDLETLEIIVSTAGRLGHYSFESSTLPISTLPLISRLNIPLFAREGGVISGLLRVRSDMAEVKAALSDKGDYYELEGGVWIGGRIHPLNQARFIVPNTPPTWALAGGELARVADEKALQIGDIFPLQIPRERAKDFQQQYFDTLSKYLPIEGEVVRWQVVKTPPIARLYLSRKGDQPIRAELRFGYGEHEYISAGLKQVGEEIIASPGEWGGIRVLRDQALEQEYYLKLSDPRYGLKRAGGEHPGIFELRARTHPLDFLMKCVPALTRVGFEIYGEKDIASVNRHRPVLTLNISSGIDWFDVQAIVQYGDQQVSLNEIRRALRQGERYIKLADGSIGQIPEEWLEKYKHLFALAEETADGLRVSDLQLSLLDELLADAETKNIAPEFHARRERLRSFERIAAQPLPQDFSGELRPYQKAGYDWLHFLREYGFGGILADDMGLGKTIQALAFLQSLKERGELTRPALLVVPKSLLVNWQREAGRFTPGLRVLQFTGQGRKKEPAHFENYDLVLTTYGTMLRDIEFLRDYRFAWAILDESQAIKNPFAQSSKAVRLLQADHRLCLTGTPVENNVYELWSQFAFLNPGLLGSLDYFKSEFGGSIEAREDSAQPAMQVLRRLIYPFILRRTKDQVAPELPPRTERIIYTDLEPAQRRLYQHTRDYYRAMLLGMIEENGDINHIRFRILEGLLRMRQICIHPKLVEPTHKGESAKFEVLLETLETLRAEGHKALVFSQFVRALGLLQREMKARGMAYAYLDGKTQNRQEEVDRFQNDPSIPFFLISLKAGGVGLNLTAADYVLHIDPWWNPAVEMQAADRAHRIGQDKPVFVYKFIARETVEERILQLQARKRELVEQLISTESGFFKSLTREDVEILFS